MCHFALIWYSVCVKFGTLKLRIIQACNTVILRKKNDTVVMFISVHHSIRKLIHSVQFKCGTNPVLRKKKKKRCNCITWGDLLRLNTLLIHLPVIHLTNFLHLFSYMSGFFPMSFFITGIETLKTSKLPMWKIIINVAVLFLRACFTYLNKELKRFGLENWICISLQ